MKYFLQFLVTFCICSCNQTSNSLNQISVENKDRESLFVTYKVNPSQNEISLYWKDDSEDNFGNAKKLSQYLESQGSELLFSTNGGMYLKDRSPQGLYIEKGEVISYLDTISSAYGNFYMQPNGVFYLTNSNEAKLCKSLDFNNDNVKYATQSGPMLISDGKLHPKFQKESKSKFVRNGVGVLPSGEVLFVQSKKTINFYDFATYFKNKDCKQALYLDGFVSRTYLPSKNWIQLDGNFGVMIAVTKRLE